MMRFDSGFFDSRGELLRSFKQRGYHTLNSLPFHATSMLNCMLTRSIARLSGSRFQTRFR
ncbi:hypothetical protein DAI22_01g463133 [Oryza sativa Japonica Group]|nr:hypothetical protein DAI22_01g463133 [Oryza sativa Japonica Group]